MINMKRFVFLSIFIILSLFCNSQTVYITKTGKKYHEQTCRYLSSSSIPINVSDAINRGFSSCSICTPAQLPNNPSQRPSFPSNPKENPQTPGKSSRCTAITKAGNQCSRAPRSNGLCWQHGG
jgi:hypothetical protein